ncbi:unnamed protein product [Paramecium octaurelia]|uniref:Uncharacterized protein n=1 Tax=Paramecium octaurelia TaxID=43137 RepID=A0A8S1S5S7_PAROT|nr:unnamed protein product [Paramecium octaurelia]
MNNIRANKIKDQNLVQQKFSYNPLIKNQMEILNCIQKQLQVSTYIQADFQLIDYLSVLNLQMPKLCNYLDSQDNRNKQYIQYIYKNPIILIYCFKIDMDQSQYSIHQLLQTKRDLLRETIRKNDLMKTLEDKRIKIQQNQEDQECQITQSNSSKKRRRNRQKIETENTSEEDGFDRLTKLKSKKNLTPTYLIQILDYLKTDPCSFQVIRILELCEGAILDEKLINSPLVPYLVEIIFVVTKYKQSIPFKPLLLLLKAFAIHQEYIILQYIQMYLQNNKQEKHDIDQYCKQKYQCQEQNLIYIICKNFKYANLQMQLFLCETIRNKEIVQAIQFYGGFNFDTTIEYQKEYRSTIKKLQQLAEILLSGSEFYFMPEEDLNI